MNSNDIFITINGIDYRVNLEKQDNHDEIITRLDRIENRLDNIENRVNIIEQKQEIMHEDIRGLHEGQRILADRIDTLQTSVYWVLAVIGIFLAALVLPSIIRRPENTQSSHDNYNSVNDIANAMLRAFSAGKNCKD